MKRHSEDTEEHETKRRRFEYSQIASTELLPADCLFHVYSFCEPRDVFLIARLVSKCWNEVVNNMERFWRRLYANFFALHDKREDDDQDEEWEKRFKMRYESCLFLDENYVIARLVEKMSRLTNDVNNVTIDKWERLSKYTNKSRCLIDKRNIWLEMIANLCRITDQLESPSLSWFSSHNHCLFLQHYPPIFSGGPKFDEQFSEDVKLSIVLYGVTMVEVIIQVQFNIYAQYFEMAFSVHEDYDDEETDPVIFMYFANPEYDSTNEFKIHRQAILKLTESLLGEEYDIPTQYMPREEDSSQDSDEDEEKQVPIPLHFTLLRIYMTLFDIGKAGSASNQEQTLQQHFQDLWKRVMDGIDNLQTVAIETGTDSEELNLAEVEPDDMLNDEDRNFIAPDHEVVLDEQEVIDVDAAPSGKFSPLEVDSEEEVEQISDDESGDENEPVHVDDEDPKDEDNSMYDEESDSDENHNRSHDDSVNFEEVDDDE
jgi:hypothetical protein